MPEHIRGFTSGSAEQLLSGLQQQRFSGTLVLYAEPGWLLAFIVSGETEQLARFGKYPGLGTPGQHFVQFAHEVGRTAELPARANWPVFPATATWPTALVPLPVALRNLAGYQGLIALHDEDHSTALLGRGQVLLARNNAGSLHSKAFAAGYQQATAATFMPLPNEVHEALLTAEPPAEFTRGTSTVLTLRGMQDVALPAPVEVPAEVPAPTPKPTPPPTPQAAPTPTEPPAAAPAASTTPYRVTLRGRDALDPMSDRASEFRATTPPGARDVLRAIAAGRATDAPSELLNTLVQGGYIYVPEEA